MPVVGETHTPQIVISGSDPGLTEAALTVIDPIGERTDWAAVGYDPAWPANTWVGAPLALLMPGDYWTRWIITGPGAGPPVLERIAVAPGADPFGEPEPGAAVPFANTRDLAAYSGKAPPADAARLLADASREIERITRTAVYALDPAGLPADPGIRRAMADATCELVGWWAETGTRSGARGLYTSASIAGVSLGFGGKAAGSAGSAGAERIGPKVLTILTAARLIRAGVRYG